jgi:hypothetical protein
VLSVIVTAVAPGAWWVLGASMLAGIALGVVMIAMRRHKAG